MKRRSPGRGDALVKLVLIGALLVPAVRPARANEQSGSVSSAASGIDYLPNVTLQDQIGRSLSLASLKGKPALVAFIHTSCGGVCQLTTAKMKTIAQGLNPSFGSKVTMLTFTTDPKEDHPAQLAAYAKAQGATGKGWIFLTGSSADIARVLQLYGLPNDPDDAMNHVEELRLIGPDGAERKHYVGDVKVATVVVDIKTELAQRE
jgi:protein SCO1/2